MNALVQHYMYTEPIDATHRLVYTAFAPHEVSRLCNPQFLVYGVFLFYGPVVLVPRCARSYTFWNIL